MLVNGRVMKSMVKVFILTVMVRYTKGSGCMTCNTEKVKKHGLQVNLIKVASKKDIDMDQVNLRIKTIAYIREAGSKIKKKATVSFKF